MKMTSKAFFTGIGVGVIAGATLAVVISPPDKKRMMKSGPGRAIRTLSRVAEGIVSSI